jgi:hypothetical protein
MARQSGIIKLEGTIGDLTFYKSSDGMLARMKGGVDGDRIRKDPAFARTRENGSEFARAGSAGKLLRSAFRQMVMKAGDRYMVSRLTKEMVAVVKADATSVRGERNVLDGELELLIGFNFNEAVTLGDVFRQPVSNLITRADGTAVLNVQAFNGKEKIVAPVGATHAQLILGFAAIDFEAGTFESVESRSGFLSVDAVNVPDVVLSAELQNAGDYPLFLLVGIEFFQMVNGNYYSLTDSNYNALTIMNVVGV